MECVKLYFGRSYLVFISFLHKNAFNITVINYKPIAKVVTEDKYTLSRSFTLLIIHYVIKCLQRIVWGEQ